MKIIEIKKTDKKKSSSYEKKMFRLVYILSELNNGGSVTVKNLAKEFGVSVRTVERDINLLETTGFILDMVDKGKYKFYEGFSLDKTILTGEEISIISVMNEITSSLGERFEKSFKSLLARILTSELASPYFVKLSDGVKLKEDFKFIDQLEKSISQSKKIKVYYKRMSDNEEKDYLLSPLKIVFYDGFWYLAALTYNNNLVKFRIDNITGVKPTTEKFDPPENLKEMLENSVSIFFSNEKKTKAVLSVDREVADYFRKKKIFPDQKIIEEKKDGTIIIESKYGVNVEIMPLIQHWMPYIKVIEPVDLAENVRETVKKYLEII